MPPIDPTDQAELTQLVNAVALSDRTLTLFAIAPDSSSHHPVVQAFQAQLQADLEEPLQFSTLHYSDDSLFKFLQRSEGEPLAPGRRVVMIFGLEQLPPPRLKHEMEQLNLGRERIFAHNLVLVFWLNRAAFLDEFRQRAADFWDWRGNVATFTTCPPPDQLLYPYLEWLIAENSYLKMTGVMQVNRQVDISLDQIYVSLQAEWVEERSQSFRERVSPGAGRTRSRRGGLDGLEAPGAPDDYEDESRDEPLWEMEAEPTSRQRVTKLVDVAEVVRKQEYGVILGDPGAGKTTLLRYLARHFAIAYREGQVTVLGGMQEDLGATRLPILFRIADYAERLAHQPELSLGDYLQQFYRQWEGQCDPETGDAVAVLLLNKMAAGDCLLLLDGLDEVLDEANRGRVVRAIDRFVNDYRLNKFVITSRIAGYQAAALSSRFREFTITPMGNEQIRQFLERWCLAIEVAQRPEAEASLQQRDAEQEAQGILRAIETKPGVQRFATNPLLLTILALIHRNGTQMPQRRVELYALATKTLIEDWQLARNNPYRAQARQLVLVEEEVIALLAPLAFWMHEEKSSGLVTQAEVEGWLTPLMVDLQGVEESVAVDLVQQFLRQVRETTGLFVERGPGVYGFMHLTFEEYFAARHIANNDVPDILAMIKPYRHQARWHEPILLALGYLSADQKRLNRLLELWFGSLADYQPMVSQEIRLKQVAVEPVLVWYEQPEGESRESAVVWQDLLFVGQVLAEVKVAPKFCRQQVEKLVLTYLGLEKDYSEEPTQQLLRLLRGIELFNHQVLARLQQAAVDEQLSEEQQDEAIAAILYILCGEAGERLTDRVTEILQQLTPSLFSEICNLMAELGAEMTPALERGLADPHLDAESRRVLEFMTGLSYLRSDNYDNAIAHLQPLADQANCHLDGFIDWAIAISHEEKENYSQGLNYYRQCSEKLQSFILWRNWGICYRSHQQYEQSLDCFQQALDITKQLANRKAEALIIYHLGRTYQTWGKYEEAISYHQQSRDLYQQLGKTTNVANQWYWIGDCYKDWSKYDQAIECQQQCLDLRHLEDDQTRVALSLYQLGRIYQVWGKYEQAIIQYERSRNIYRQIEKESDVANQWYWMGDCYKDWGNYEQAIECQKQCLDLRGLKDDHAMVAISYFQLGRIYKAWGNYEKTIFYYQQSRDIYQQLGREKEVSYRWYNLAECYREWGKYEQALECEQKDLELCQKLELQSDIALSYDQFGQIYQAWGKYETAISYYEKSRDLYQQLNKGKDIAKRWYSLADCYRDWGKYQRAFECQQQYFELCQTFNTHWIASAQAQLGRIYQSCGKDERAISHYQQSRDLYQQLEKEKDVANQCDWIASCYREWGKYDLALEAEQQNLAVRQQLDDQSGIANAYFQLGTIYQAWGQYETAISQYQKSRNLYQQLEKEKDVANQWYWIGDCYKDWGKYEQAIECQQQCLDLRRLEDDQSRVALSLYQLGRIYQAWGKYEQAISQYQKSRNLYQQLEKEKGVANQWYWIGDCYKDWGKYEQAIECQKQCLDLRRLEDNQSRVALSLYQLGRIYQAWGKYETAIEHYQQSRNLYQQLGQEKEVSYRWYNLAECYRKWGKYEQALECEQKDLELCQKLDLQDDIAMSYYQLARIYQAWGRYEEAINYHQQSCDLYQQVDKTENLARQLRRIANSQRQLAQTTADSTAALALLTQAQQTLHQAIQLNTTNEYQENSAYDHITLSLVYAERLRHLPTPDPTLINRFQATYEIGLTRLTTLGQTVSHAQETLDIARAYLEIPALQDLDLATTLTQQALQTLQTYNRRKLQADAHKLLGQIYQRRAQPTAATQAFQQSRQLYQALDLPEKVAEVERAIDPKTA